MSASPAFLAKKRIAQKSPNAKETVSDSLANEIVFAVVGHVGSGTSEIATQIKDALEREGRVGGAYEAHVIKASELIKESLDPDELKMGAPGIAVVEKLQDAGDAVRSGAKDGSQLAKLLVDRIRRTRALSQGVEIEEGVPVIPDGRRRAYILDSLRHPDEVKLLRAIYHDAFVLVGIVCDPEVRRKRLIKKYQDATSAKIDSFMARDADGQSPFGQKVADTFFQADFFIDNTQPRFLTVGGVDRANPSWSIAEELVRLEEMVTQSRVVRPTLSETAMYHAHGARMRSACLSRQVGAALMDGSGEIIATGCNEAPSAGGGVYTGDGDDYRCAFHHKYCSSVREQNRIIDEIIVLFPALGGDKLQETKDKLRASPIAGLLEFSRAVHAEMDALLAAARRGITTVGSKLYVTTYPCHYCARHIIAAGVDEVQYIEPYPKSLATKLHDDAITVDRELGTPSLNKQKRRLGNGEGVELKVLFRPFTGVAPRLYRRVFLKEQSLKDKHSGEMRISRPDWGEAVAVKRVSYIDLEAKIINGD